MLILLTGATGFIGSHIARRLLDARKDVRVIARPSGGKNHLIDPRIDIRVGEFTDKRFLAECVEESDIVINAAGRLGEWGVSEEELNLVNIGLVESLLEVLQHSSVKQFIHFSTPGVLGMVGRAPECMPPRPRGIYERTKHYAETVALSYHKKGSVPVTVLRPDFVYGPGDIHKLRMFKAVQTRQFPVLGSGSSLLHPTYVDDVVNGTMLAMLNPAAYGHIFNLAGPRAVTSRELVSAIASELNVKVQYVRVSPALLRMGAFAAEMAYRVAGRKPPITRQQIRSFTCDHASDISKAVTMLGYRPCVSLQEGIARTIEWYKQEGYL